MSITDVYGILLGLLLGAVVFRWVMMPILVWWDEHGKPKDERG